MEGGETDPDVQMCFGYMYEHGLNSKKRDLKLAAKWYSKAAEQEHPLATASLGRCYLEGLGVEIDHARAFELLKEAADLGIVVALFYLGECYRNGYGVRMNLKKALQLYGEAEKNGCKKATAILKDIAVEHQDIDDPNLPKARDSFKNAGKSKTRPKRPSKPQATPKQSLSEIFAPFDRPPHAPPPSENDISQLKSLAKQNHALAQYFLGRAYFHGQGVRGDFVNAMRLLRKSTAVSHKKQAMSSLYVAFCYLFGYGIEPNLEQVLKSAHFAQTLGDPSAKVLFQSLSKIQRKGEEDINKIRSFVIESLSTKIVLLNSIKCPRSMLLRITTFKAPKSASGVVKPPPGLPPPGMMQSNVRAMPPLLPVAANSQAPPLARRSVPSGPPAPRKDKVKALQHQSKGGDSRAQARLGICYLFGYVVRKDEVNAVRWFSKSAGKIPLGAYCLACCLTAGVGIERDLQRAYLLAKEAVKGVQLAEELLKELGRVKRDKDGIHMIPTDLSSFKYLSGFGCYELFNFVDFIKATPPPLPEHLNPPKEQNSAPSVAILTHEGSRPEGLHPVRKVSAPKQTTGSSDSKEERLVNEIQKKAKAGNADMQWRLGICYLMGFVVRQDDVNATRWFAKSAKNSPMGRYCLACCLVCGRGMERDLNRVVKTLDTLKMIDAYAMLEEVQKIPKDDDGCYILPEDMSSFRFLSGNACEELYRHVKR